MDGTLYKGMKNSGEEKLEMSGYDKCLCYLTTEKELIQQFFFELKVKL